MLGVLQKMSRAKLAIIGFVLIAAPFYFVAAALLKYGLGVGFLFDPLANFFAEPSRLRVLNLALTPVLFFGGSLLALALNVFAVLRRSGESARPGRFANLAVVVTSISRSKFRQVWRIAKARFITSLRWNPRSLWRSSKDPTWSRSGSYRFPRRLAASI